MGRRCVFRVNHHPGQSTPRPGQRRTDRRLGNADRLPDHSGETGLRVTIRTPGSAVARAEMSRGSTVRTITEPLVAQAQTSGS